MKKLLSLLLVLTMLVSSIPMVFAEADGTSAENAIEISTVDQLKTVGTTGYYKLTADIDLGGSNWTPIGTLDVPFAGHFNGNGHIIKNFALDCTSDKVAYGLFGASEGTVINLGLEDVKFKTSLSYSGYFLYSGALVGNLVGEGKISGCYVKDIEYVNPSFWNGDSGSVWVYGGGIVGQINSTNAVVENSYITGLIMNDALVNVEGGIVAAVQVAATVKNCYSTTTGLTVFNNNAAEISNVYYVTAPWTQDNFPFKGTKVSDADLKTKADALGSAFCADVENMQINDGYPILTWQKGEKLSEGEAHIASSNPADNATDINIFDLEAEISFDKLVISSMLSEDTISVSPAVDYTVTVLNAEYVDKVAISFDTLELNTTYTISFSEEIETVAGGTFAAGESVSFTTVAELPAFEVSGTLPADSAKDVVRHGATLKFVYTLPIDFTTVSEDNFTVSPSAEFTVSSTDSENEILITFTKELAPKTLYTVKASNIYSLNSAMSEEAVVTFTTEAGFENLVENGDMENTTSFDAFYDASNNSSFSYVRETELKGTNNTVLKFSPVWADQPILLVNVPKNSGRYYMGAWVKSDADQKVNFIINDTGESWSTHSVNLEAGKWTYVGSVHTVSGGKQIKQLSINAVGGKGLSVDDWCVYELAKAPTDNLTIVSSTIFDGATEVSPIGLTAEFEFNVPVKQSTLLDGITLQQNGGAGSISNIKFDTADLYKCTVEFSRLDAAQSYAIDLSGVESMAGKKLADKKIEFTTVTVGDSAANVVSTVPAANATAVGRNDFVIEIVFDSPIEPSDASKITVTPDLSAKPVISADNLKKCVITIDKTKYENGKTYTVTVPDTVKTINGYPCTPYTFKFTTINEQDVYNVFNGALGNANDMKTAVESIYTELGKTSSAYEYLLDNMSDDVINSVYADISNSGRASNIDDVYNAIAEASFKAILNNTDDNGIIIEILSENSGIVDEGTEEIFNENLTEQGKKSVAKSAYGFKSQSGATIRENLAVTIICKALESSGGPEAVEKILKLAQSNFTGENDISELIEEIDKYKSPNKIYTKLQNISVNSLSEIRQAVVDAIDDVKSNDGGSSGGGAGGGMGGGSIGGNKGGTTSGIWPVVSPETVGNESQEVVFGDISNVDWAYDSILYLYEKGIINGKANKIFAPNDNLTRAEFAKIAVTALGDIDTTLTVDFDDVSPDDWSYVYIANAYNKNLINGIGDNKFGGDQYISRQDMAVILARMAKNASLDVVEKNVSFDDFAKVADYAKDSVTYLSSIGIINGVGNGCFDPEGCTTRAAAAVVFHRFLNLLGE